MMSYIDKGIYCETVILCIVKCSLCLDVHVEVQFLDPG